MTWMIRTGGNWWLILHKFQETRHRFQSRSLWIEIARLMPCIAWSLIIQKNQIKTRHHWTHAYMQMLNRTKDSLLRYRVNCMDSDSAVLDTRSSSSSWEEAATEVAISSSSDLGLITGGDINGDFSGAARILVHLWSLFIFNMNIRLNMLNI